MRDIFIQCGWRKRGGREERRERTVLESATEKCAYRIRYVNIKRRMRRKIKHAGKTKIDHFIDNYPR